jgi:hypothetical protein
MMGNKARERETEREVCGEREREVWGERERSTWREKTAWVDLTVGLNQQHLSISLRRQSIEQYGLAVNQDQGGFQHSLANLSRQHSLE